MLVAAVVVLLVLQREGGPEPAEAGTESVQKVYVPDDVADPEFLERRTESQLATADQIGVFHDFRFSDRLESSGITFRHRIVDDAGITFKKVHYDHGNSVSVADVNDDGLYDVYFTNQIGANQLWRNIGGGRFEDVTARAGTAMEEAVSVGASFADMDNDGDADLFVSTVRFGNALFENDGTGRFTDISESAGVDRAGHSSGAVFLDYDRDGLLDLYVTQVGTYTTDAIVEMDNPDDNARRYTFYSGIGDDEAFMGHLDSTLSESNILYRNLGDNRFADVTKEVGLVDDNWSGDAAVFDANSDGWPDLYILDMQGNDAYFENVEGRRFEEKTSELFPKTPWGAMGVEVLDYDNDGRLDLYVTDMHSDMWEADEFIYEGREKQKPRLGNIPDADHLGTTGTSIFGNALFRNDGDASFTDVADRMGAETYWPWGVSAGDLNADGYEDLFVASSMNYPYRYAVNKLLLNDEGGRFRDSEFVLGIEPRSGNRMAVPWFRVNCAEMWHERCPSSDDPATIEVWGAVGSRSSVIFDLDDDGDLDIITNDFNSPPMVLVSNLSEQRDSLRYIKVDLIGSSSNRDGLGAVVRVVTDSMTMTQVHDGKSGYLAQSSLPLYFGLGDEEIRQIEITWPSGRRQIVEGDDIRLNQILEITEPNAN